MPAGDDEARELARTLRALLEWAHESGGARSSEVVGLLGEHLGDAGRAESVVGRELPPFEQVNLQVALDVWTAVPQRRAVVQGLSLPPHYSGLSLQQLLHGDGLPPVRLSAPALTDLPAGPDRTVACLTRALLLVEDSHGRYVLLVRGPEPHEEPVLSLEVAGLATAAAQEVLRELAELRSRHNVYRGQVVELVHGRSGPALEFPALPRTTRDDVVLPDDVLRRVERHALEVGRRRDALRAAGQHLKRGLLLYGPPGTGKTHTTRYVVQQMAGSTVLLLSGAALHAVGTIAQLARDLQPAVVVLEDVDLVAEDREYGPNANPVLFSLLDAMDGAAGDADLLFLLTTNRADLLEPALAARPGRIDVAVEIGLPDAPSRRRLFDLYARAVPLDVSPGDVDAVVERTDGVTASFMKELLRRAVLEALTDRDAGPHHGTEGSPERTADVPPVAGEHLRRALDDLLDSAQGVTRALLGVPGDDDRDGAAPYPAPVLRRGRSFGLHGGQGWARPGVMPAVYTDE